MAKTIYLDNAATMPMYPEVARTINETEKNFFGNPSSSHRAGEEAREIVLRARERIAREINARPEEIIFTSGATESINLALQGAARADKKYEKSRRDIIITSSFEHSAVYETCQHLRTQGYNIMELPVSDEGIVNIEKFERLFGKKVLLFSIIHGHNELGVIQDIEKMGRLCREKKILFHVDASQSLGREKIDVRKMNIDLLSASAHKIGGPKGIGFLFVKHGIMIEPLIFGGGQERGLRGGTENVSGIAGFARALEITSKINKDKLKKLRNYCILELQKLGGKINGSEDKRLYNSINVTLDCNAENLIYYLSRKGIFLSAKSACDSKINESRALKALGLNEKEIHGTLRIVLNEFTSKNDINMLIWEIKKGLKKFKLS